MNSAEVRNFHYAIETYINQSELPLEVKRLVLKDIYSSIEIQAHNEIYEQLKTQEEESKNA